MFLNCGGVVDLTKTWFYQLQQDSLPVKAFIMDSHRPFHHNNVIDEHEMIFVIDDGCKSFQECPTAEDAIIMAELNQMSSDSEEDDSDELDEQDNSEESEQDVKPAE